MATPRVRLMRINWLKKVIGKVFSQGRNIYEEKLVSELCLRWGSARRTVREYLRDLETTGFIFRDNGMIAPTPKASKEEAYKEVDDLITSYLDCQIIEDKKEVKENEKI